MGRTPEARHKEYMRTKEQVKIRVAKWAKDNPEKVRGYFEKHYDKNKDKIKQRAKDFEIANPHRCWARNSIRSHKQQGYTVLINVEELELIAIKTIQCPYCDIILNYARRRGTNNVRVDTPSLDRIENGQILTTQNVQIVCWPCNSTKLDRSHNNFIKYCQRIVEKFCGNTI